MWNSLINFCSSHTYLRSYSSSTELKVWFSEGTQTTQIALLSWRGTFSFLSSFESPSVVSDGISNSSSSQICTKLLKCPMSWFTTARICLVKVPLYNFSRCPPRFSFCASYFSTVATQSSKRASQMVLPSTTSMCSNFPGTHVLSHCFENIVSLSKKLLLSNCCIPHKY